MKTTFLDWWARGVPEIVLLLVATEFDMYILVMRL